MCACLAALLLLAGCGSEPAPPAAKKAEPKAPPEPVTALSAVYKMYQSGRTWAADLEPIEVQAIPLTEIAAKDGKYPAWQAVFVSPSLNAKKTYTFSLIEKGEQLHEGVFGRQEESFAQGGPTVPFSMPSFRTDSPAALKTALEKGGEAFHAKNPNLPVMMKLQRERRDNSPVWKVYWGATELSSPFAVFVNADTGDFIKVTR